MSNNTNLNDLINAMNSDGKEAEEEKKQDVATTAAEETEVNEVPAGEEMVDEITSDAVEDAADDGDAEEVEDGDVIYEGREWSAKARDPEVIQQMLKSVMADNNLHINTTEWAGSISYLLSYIVSLQKRFSLTLPLESIGISTDIFNLIDRNEDGTFEFGDDLYELIKVDSRHYMSCVTSPSDQSQFERIARELLCSFNEKGRYTLRRTGYRIFVGELNASEQTDVVSDQAERSLIYALTLNSFELEALATFAAEVPGVKITEGVDREGNDIITFVVEDTDDVEDGDEIAEGEEAAK